MSRADRASRSAASPNICPAKKRDAGGFANRRRRSPSLRGRPKERPLKRIGVIAVIVAIGVGLVACGSDNDDESGELSTSEFAAQANKICENITKKVDDALENVNPGIPAGAESAQAIAEVATLDKEQIGHVDDLPAPESEQDDIDQLLDHWRDRADQEQQISDAAESGDTATIEGLNSQLNQIEDDANAIATKLGLDKCTRGGT